MGEWSRSFCILIFLSPIFLLFKKRKQPEAHHLRTSGWSLFAPEFWRIQLLTD